MFLNTSSTIYIPQIQEKLMHIIQGTQDHYKFINRSVTFKVAVLFFIHTPCRSVSAAAHQWFCECELRLLTSSPASVARHDQCTVLELWIEKFHKC